jgi:hypothetical protein
MADFDVTSASHPRVQTELSAELSDDVAENLRILRRRVWIAGRHDAAATEVDETDLRLGQPKPRARPLSLAETFNTAALDYQACDDKVCARFQHRRNASSTMTTAAYVSGPSRATSRAQRQGPRSHTRRCADDSTACRRADESSRPST